MVLAKKTFPSSISKHTPSCSINSQSSVFAQAPSVSVSHPSEGTARLFIAAITKSCLNPFVWEEDYTFVSHSITQ